MFVSLLNPVENLCKKQFWSVFSDGFRRILVKFPEFLKFVQKCEVCSKLSSMNAYVHYVGELKAWDKDESTSLVPK